MGLLDNIGNGGLFGNQWADVIAAMQNGKFDPQGANGQSPALLSMPQPNARPGWENDPQAVAAMRAAFGQSPMTAMAQAPTGLFPPNPGDSVPPPMAPQGMPSQGMPPQGMAPQQAPQMPMGAPGFGDRLQAAGASFFNAGSPMQALGGLIGGLVTGQRQDPMGIHLQQQGQQQFAMYKALRDAGISDDQAQAGALDPKVGEQLLSAPNEVRLYQYARGQGYKGSLIDFQQELKSERTKMVDQGTQTRMVDNSGKTVAIFPKDVAGHAAAEAKGKAQGEAQGAAPGSLIEAENTIKQVDELLAHPGMEKAVGPVYGHAPKALTIGAERDFVNRLEQLKGGAFLEAYKTLKGGGSITEVEGTKATAAIARMDRAANKEDFVQAMHDFQGAVRRGVEKLKAQGGNASPAAAGGWKVERVD